MARKGEKAKARKSPDKSPRRVGRPSRRRKKSDSESSEEKKTAEPAEVEQGESSESVRMRRSTRRQPEQPSTSEPKPQSSEWKEDETFWSKEDEESNKTEANKEDSASMWKVQTSNGSGGEIQKLRICRQRPGGAGSDSAESSMSPAKESSPIHKRSSKKESQKSPLVESNVSEIELPPAAGSSEPLDTSEISLPPNQASGEGVPDVDSKKAPQKVVEYIYETQPSIMTEVQSTPPPIPPPPQVNETSSPPSETKDISLPPIVDQLNEAVQSVDTEAPSADSNQQLDRNEEVKPSLEPTTDNKPEDTSQIEVPPLIEEKITEPVVSNDEKVDETESAVEDVPRPSDNTTAEQTEKLIVERSDDSKTEIAEINQTVSSAPEQRAPVENRSKSDDSVKSGGSRRSSVSGPASAHSESNEPVLEISVNKSPIQEGKEEGEIVDDEKTETADMKEKRRIVIIRTKSEESSPVKITLNRRSTTSESNSTNISSKPGNTPSGTAATTAKKHPLITGPEPDDSPAVRRRKLTSLGTANVIFSGGTTRPVRSIPGEALKAVLQPDTEKKDKEKRSKVTVKVKEEKPESGGGELTSNESKLNIVEDVREILKNNRANEKKAAAERETRLSAKSPSKSAVNSEIKAPARKVSIGSAPVIEEVKTVKPSRSKSPIDSKATPTLFITNLVRPFTAGQLKELLARTGTIVNNGFFIDKIKSKCFVKYADTEMAIETRHALNGVRWPVSNPKVLKVSYAADKELKEIQDSAEGEIVNDISTPHSGSGWLSSEQAVFKEKEKRKSLAPSTREWDRGKTKSNAEGDVIFVEEYSKEEKYRQVTEVVNADRNERTRDRHERDKPIKEDHSRNHCDRDKERERDRERDRDRRKRHSSPVQVENSPPPARKFKKKDYDAPAKLLDVLFRKTKTSPCLYWLPLSAEQIAISVETRDRRFAEWKKTEQQRRDKERERDRDRRRK